MSSAADITMTSITPRHATRREWLGLAVLVLPTLLLALDMTVLHLATPHLSADLRPTSSQLLWILDIYGFMIAGFLITMGTLGDRIGRRRLLLIGALAFGVASVFAAFSTTANMLILARALLGVAGATLMPSTLSLIRNMFHMGSERTLAITIWMTGFIVGGALGPLVGGIMLEFFWWGSVFLLGVPVMVLLLIAGPLLLPEFRDARAGRLDLFSALLSIATFLLVIYGLKGMAREGVHLLAVLAVLAGLAVGTFFVRRQRLIEQPMLDLRLFINRAFSTSVCAMMLTILALSGAWLMVFQYLQGVLGLSPLKTGLLMLPAAIMQVMAALLVPMVARRLRPSVLISSGLMMAVLGFLAMTLVDDLGTVYLLVLGSVVVGVGVMPTMILSTDLVVSSVPAAKAGTAASISETASELGMALGIAVIGSIGTAVYRNHLLADMPVDLSPELAAIAADTLGGALVVIEQLAQEQGAELLLLVQAAFSDALHVNALIGAGIVFSTAVASGLLLRHIPIIAGEGDARAEH